MDSQLLRGKEARRITLMGFLVNAVLTFIKLIAGFVGNSQAMIADGIHSLSDFLSDIVVLIGFKFTDKPEDQDHPYGHGKFETVATVVIGVMLFFAGFSILKSGISSLYAFIKGDVPVRPGYIAVLAALASMAAKEVLFRITLKVGTKIESSAVTANAWHHRSDVYSSIGTFIGVAAAAALGNKWAILDPIASIVVSFFIFKVGIEIFMPSMNELLEKGVPQEEMDYLYELLENSEDVMAYHEVRARKLSNRFVIEFHLMVSPDMNITKAHDIATSIENEILEHFGEDSIVTSHIEPYCAKEIAYYGDKHMRDIKNSSQ